MTDPSRLLGVSGAGVSGWGVSLRRVVADGAARVRAERGLDLDAAGALLRGHGLGGWTGGTVAQVEAGVRALAVEELLLLCLAYGTTPAALTGDADGWVELGSGARVDASVLLALLTGTVPPGRPGGVDVPATRPTAPAPPEALVLAAARFGVLGPTEVARALAGIGDAERNAARRLGVSPERLVFAAVGRWGRTLAAERDARIEARRAETDESLHITLRGLVVRELLLELEADLAPPAAADPAAAAQAALAAGTAAPAAVAAAVAEPAPDRDAEPGGAAGVPAAGKAAETAVAGP